MGQLLQSIVQNMLLKSVSLAYAAFKQVSVYGFRKIARRHTYRKLYGRGGLVGLLYLLVNKPYRIGRYNLALAGKQIFNDFTAFEAFRTGKCVAWGQESEK